MGRGFTWKQVTIASLCNSGLEWIYQGVCRYIQGNLVGNAQLFAKSGNIIFLDFKRDVVAPCFSWFPCLFYDIHTCLNFCLDFEVLSWRRSYEYTCRLLACLCLSNLISISSSTWKPETLMLSSFFDDLCCDFDQQFFDCQHWAVIKKVDIFAKMTKTREEAKS